MLETISELFQVINLLVIIGGAFFGMLIGALPGLGATVAIVILLPLTYVMEPLPAILLLLSTYQAASYGGSISAIILGIPGTPAAVATIMDGHTLSKKSSPGKAIGYSLVASTLGGFAGGLALIFLTKPLSAVALKLADPEYVLIAIIGLITAASLGTKDVTKALISVALGFLASTIGMDMFTGNPRFTFGFLELSEGLQLVPVLMGLYAITEVLDMATRSLKERFNLEEGSMKVSITWKEFKNVWGSIGLGSALGVIIGGLPGLGPPTATWITYSASKKMAKDPETFGQGNPKGIAGPESANNAAVGGALIPLLLLGIPGSATIAVISGAFIVHGVNPGPRLFVENLQLTNGILYGFLLTTVALFIVGKILTPLFARTLVVPNYILAPVVLLLSIVGTYVGRGSLFDVWIALGLAAIVFFIKKLDFSLPSFVLAYILGSIVEKGLRRTLITSDGSYMIFLERPVCLFLIIMIVLVGIYAITKKIVKKRAAN